MWNAPFVRGAGSILMKGLPVQLAEVGVRPLLEGQRKSVMIVEAQVIRWMGIFPVVFAGAEGSCGKKYDSMQASELNKLHKFEEIRIWAIYQMEWKQYVKAL